MRPVLVQRQVSDLAFPITSERNLRVDHFQEDLIYRRSK